MDEDTTYDIYLHDDRTLNLETNLEAALSNNISRDKQIKVLLVVSPLAYRDVFKIEGRNRENSLKSL